MPQSEHRREYMRRYMEKRRLGSRGGRESERGGVVPNVVPPTIEKGNVVPVPLNPRTMTKAALVGYLEEVGRHGFTFVTTSRGYALVAASTGELVPFDAVAALESTLALHGQRITQLEADIVHLEIMIDSLVSSDTRDGL